MATERVYVEELRTVIEVVMTIFLQVINVEILLY